jgi:hypothetical protein
MRWLFTNVGAPLQQQQRKSELPLRLTAKPSGTAPAVTAQMLRIP